MCIYYYHTYILSWIYLYHVYPNICIYIMCIDLYLYYGYTSLSWVISLSYTYIPIMDISLSCVCKPNLIYILIIYIPTICIYPIIPFICLYERKTIDPLYGEIPCTLDCDCLGLREGQFVSGWYEGGGGVGDVFREVRGG